MRAQLSPKTRRKNKAIAKAEGAGQVEKEEKSNRTTERKSIPWDGQEKRKDGMISIGSSPGTYSGEIINEVPNGLGVWHDADFYNLYIGEWKDGLRNGQGISVHHPSGKLFVGTWKAGRKDSQKASNYKTLKVGNDTGITGEYSGEFKYRKYKAYLMEKERG